MTTCLVYTAWDMQPLARDLDYEGPPFDWDERRRGLLRSELRRMLRPRLYGLTRKQLRYVLDPHDLTDRELADDLGPLGGRPRSPAHQRLPWRDVQGAQATRAT